MPYKTILVHIDTDQRSSVRLEIALALAQTHNAHLIGLHVVPPPVSVPAYVRAELGQDFSERERQAAAQVSGELEAAFKAACDRFGVSTIEFRVSRLDAVDAFVRHARFADLIVLGQHDPGEQRSSIGADAPELITLHAGRPVLVIPYAGRWPAVGRNALVAWSGTREAIRAVTDAVPLLQSADNVIVLAVNATRATDVSGPTPGADCALFLARHGVKAQASSDPGIDIDVGNYLLSRATDLGADLIVMGAYGHARIRELVLGGVTRTMMQHMTVPVLLSH